jgi:hypothetical protein
MTLDAPSLGEGFTPRDVGATLLSFEEWAGVWPWLIALDDRLREAGLDGLQLYTGMTLNHSPPRAAASHARAHHGAIHALTTAP